MGFGPTGVVQSRRQERLLSRLFPTELPESIPTHEMRHGETRVLLEGSIQLLESFLRLTLLQEIGSPLHGTLRIRRLRCKADSPIRAGDVDQPQNDYDRNHYLG